MKTLILWRYLSWQWLRIFLLTVIGLPAVQSLIATTDDLNALLSRGVASETLPAIFLFGLPEGMFQMMPAAALFATVFTIGPFSRHSELTAAKAGGISFRQLIVPLLLLAALAAVADYYVGEYSTIAKSRQVELSKERQASGLTTRYNFVYRADDGWSYSIRSLDTRRALLQQLLFDRPSRRSDFVGISVTSDSATYSASGGGWTLWNGAAHLMNDSIGPVTLRFDAMKMASFTQTPRRLLLVPKEPEEMTWRELGEYIDVMERAGNNVKELAVKRWLKVTLPVTCLVITIFGAPLAITNPRGGAAVGIAVSLGTTILFLLFIQLAIGIGKSGLLSPMQAAWLPNGLFLAVGIVLLAKVRT